MNPRVLSTLSLLSLCLAAPSALAAEASEDLPVQSEGFSFSARIGGALPLGTAFGVNPAGGGPLKMSDAVNGMIPFQLDGGVFLGSVVYLGGYFMYGRLLVKHDCSPGFACGATDLRFGLNMSLHLPVSAGGKWSPWVAGGLGYEIFKPGDLVLKGLDFNVQLGADYHVSGPVWAGPFAMFTRGKFAKPNGSAETSHSWLMGGLKLMMRH
ncbi:MAG TPA: hypothetical protein VK539_12435 [Myxococcaceae bacterium]|nr:hypothetical protein [Myxococcaceae bacterium]